MRILVCGGREFDDWGLLYKTLDRVCCENQTDFYNKFDFSDFTIIQGGAKGADFLARVWGKLLYCKVEEYPADWKQYGKAAGGIRNQKMLDEGKPDLVIAFPGGTGTADMVRRARKAEVKVLEIEV